VSRIIQGFLQRSIGSAPVDPGNERGGAADVVPIAIAWGLRDELFQIGERLLWLRRLEKGKLNSSTERI